MLDPQKFGKLRCYNTIRPCEQPRFIHVPLQFDAPVAAAGGLVYSDVIDLTSFTTGQPAIFVEGIQTLIAYQRGRGTSGEITNDGFLSEFNFENGYKCVTPGRAYSALSILASNTPIINLNVYAEQAVAAPTSVLIDYYFCNFAIDEVSFTLPTV
jgi:hypothetical protein